MTTLFENLTDDEILKLVEPIVRNMMEGSTEINDAKHARDFTQRMLCIVTPDDLRRVIQKIRFCDRDLAPVL